VANLNAKVPQEVEHVLDHLQRLVRWFRCGQEQQVDVAERCQHTAAVATRAGNGEMVRFTEASVRNGVLVQRRDQPVGQFTQQAGSLKTGDLILLERVLDMLLNTREMAPKGAQRIIPRHRRARFGHGREGGGQRGCRRIGGWRRG
jgi:hypothetical protein